MNPGSHVVALYGQTVEITCTAVGYPLPTAVQWVTEPDGAPVLESYKIRLQSIEHRSKLIVKNVLPKDSQAFSCTSRDHKGRAIKEIVTMDVFGNQTSTVSFIVADLQPIRSASSVHLFAWHLSIHPLIHPFSVLSVLLQKETAPQTATTGIERMRQACNMLLSSSSLKKPAGSRRQ